MYWNVKKIAIVVLIFGISFLTLVIPTSAQPVVHNIVLSPAAPWPQSTITFNVTITSDTTINEAWLIVRECQNTSGNKMCFSDSFNESLTLLDSQLYQVSIPLKHGDATYIEYQVNIKSNEAWTKSEVNTLDLSSPPITKTIMITSPNGAETWHQGSQYDITWSTTGDISNVKIELSLNDDLTTLISDTPSNGGGSYQWTIPQDQDVSSNYYIKITDTADSTINDNSNNPFSITTPTNNNGQKSPGFEIIFVFIASGIVIYMVRRKRLR
jgi:hypothetical protein